MNDFWVGLALGLGVGIPVGVAWQDAFQMLKKTFSQKKGARTVTHTSSGPERNEGPQVLHNLAFWTVIVFAVVQVCVGAFVMYGNTRISNLQEDLSDYQACQVQRDQQFQEAYEVITASSREANDAQFKYLRAASVVIRAGEDSTQRDRAELVLRAEEYVRKYNKLQKARAENAYPQLPDEYCGPPPGEDGS